MPLKACRTTHTHAEWNILSNKLISYADCFFISKLFSLFQSFGFPVVCLLLAGKRGERIWGQLLQQGQMIYEYELCSLFLCNSSSEPFFQLLFLGFGRRVSGVLAVVSFRFACNLQLAWEILNMHTLNAVDCGIRDCNCSRSSYCCCLCCFLYVVIGELGGYIISNEPHIK